jgi:hypothetical protein
MKLQISEDILTKTRCEKGFSCLSGERDDLCKVRKRIEAEVILLETCSDYSCHYATPYAYAFFCSCPTRKEIYYRYRI